MGNVHPERLRNILRTSERDPNFSRANFRRWMVGNYLEFRYLLRRPRIDQEYATVKARLQDYPNLTGNDFYTGFKVAALCFTTFKAGEILGSRKIMGYNLPADVTK